MKRILILSLALGLCGQSAFAGTKLYPNQCKQALSEKDLPRDYIRKNFADFRKLSTRDLLDGFKIQREQDPKNLDLLISYLLTQQSLEKFESSDVAIQVQLTKAIVAIQGPTPENLAWLIKAANRAYDYDTVIDTARKLIALAPDDVKTRESLVLAMQLQSLKSKDRVRSSFQVIAACQEYLADFPDNAKLLQTMLAAQLVLARTYTANRDLHKERWSDVIPTINNLFRVGSFHKIFYYDLAYALIKKGDYSQATDLLDSAKISLDPLRVKFLRARIAVYSKQFALAQDLIDQIETESAGSGPRGEAAVVQIKDWMNKRMNREFDLYADSAVASDGVKNVPEEEDWDAFDVSSYNR